MLAGALNAAIHPALVDLLHVYDHIPVNEGHLVVVRGSVVVHGPVPLSLSTATSNQEISIYVLLYSNTNCDYGGPTPLVGGGAAAAWRTGSGTGS